MRYKTATENEQMTKKVAWILTIIGGLALILGVTAVSLHVADRHHKREQTIELENRIEDMTRRLDRVIEKLQERALEETQREIEGMG